MSKKDLEAIEAIVDDVTDCLKGAIFKIIAAQGRMLDFKTSALTQNELGRLEIKLAEGPFRQAVVASHEAMKVAFDVIAMREEFRFATKEDGFDDDIETKREIVSEINAALRVVGAALAQKSDPSPKILVVSISRDKKGRYSFEDRKTKKRTGSFTSIKEILPLRIVKDLPREAPSRPAKPAKKN